MATLSDVFGELNLLEADGTIQRNPTRFWQDMACRSLVEDRTMPDDTAHPFHSEAERIFEAKKTWHQAQARLPLKEKVRIMLRMQRDDYPILVRRNALKAWEKPWKIDP